MILSQSGKKKDVPVRGIMAAVIVLLFLCTDPCRGNMQLRRRTGCAASREDRTSLLDCLGECLLYSIIATVKMHKWKEGVAEWQN